MPRVCKRVKLEEDKLAKMKRQNAAMVLFHQTAEAAYGLFLGQTRSNLRTCGSVPIFVVSKDFGQLPSEGPSLYWGLLTSLPRWCGRR